MSDNLDTMFEGDTPKGTSAVKENDTLAFVRFCFTKLVVLSLWLIVIGTTAAGAMIGRASAERSTDLDWYALLGGLLGLVVGVFIAIWNGGVIAVFLKIEENTRKIVQAMNAASSTGVPQKTTAPQEQPKQ